jgi:multidrug transporter EmrE-like cation transporter
MSLSKGKWITSKELSYGILLGLPNLYSSIFLIYALGELNGAVAFTAVNLMNVAGGTLLGKLRWHDQVSKLQWLGLGIALVSITLLIV